MLDSTRLWRLLAPEGMSHPQNRAGTSLTAAPSQQSSSRAPTRLAITQKELRSGDQQIGSQARPTLSRRSGYFAETRRPSKTARDAERHMPNPYKLLDTTLLKLLLPLHLQV
jgi:hypothetical protein